MSNFNEANVVRSLSNRGIKVDTVRQVINIPLEGVGIKTWGKIDFLTNYCKYTVTRSNITLRNKVALDEDGNPIKHRKKKIVASTKNK